MASSQTPYTQSQSKEGELQFKGYAVHDTKKYTEFEVIDFK